MLVSMNVKDSQIVTVTSVRLRVSRSFLGQQCGLNDFGKGQKDGTEI